MQLILLPYLVIKEIHSHFIKFTFSTIRVYFPFCFKELDVVIIIIYKEVIFNYNQKPIQYKGCNIIYYYMFYICTLRIV